MHSEMVSKTLKVDSAGFCFLIKNKRSGELKVICMGESTSLSVRSRPEIDQKIVSRFLKHDVSERNKPKEI
ncbi:hypothetical protein HDF22_004890 [Mucilaginibacter lappiensis]|uniref:Uncharacterized protein n=2 Tax=Mucilaginibacter lappiensis TaxID=354630 RepID=A0A841JR26_9SPHI|nr:hypothetical protein [Mucilaginibacter lappiensis]